MSFCKKPGRWDSQNAVALKDLMAEVGCTDVPVKRLAEKGILKITQRTVLKSLPAIPEGLAVEQKPVVLNEDQEKALAHIKGRMEEEKFGVTLLYGVTDSGKTELYIRAIETCLQKNKSAIVLASGNRVDGADCSAVQQQVRENSGDAFGIDRRRT